MKIVLTLALVICTFTVVKAQENTVPTIFNIDSCQIAFKPSITHADLEIFVKEFNSDCRNPLEVDLVLKTDQINFKKLPAYYEPSKEIIPSIQNYFYVPTFQFGNYNEFENTYRLKNLAFYEANRSSILSAGYETFISTERKFGN
jgi:hypothetical protein